MPSDSWVNDWLTGDVVPTAEYRKSFGCVYDTTLGAGAASIDVTGIPTTYANLLIFGLLRSDSAVEGVELLIRFNNDSGANYGYGGGGGTSITATSLTTVGTLSLAAASATASVFSPLVLKIPNYAGTTAFKSAEWTVGNAGRTVAANNVTENMTGVWRSASAINRITFSLSAGNIITGSRLSIYVGGS